MIGLTGNEAIALGVKQCKPDVIAAYPITPQTVIVEKLAEYVDKEELDAEMILVESEHSALSAVVGASACGARTFTATNSQGLALMSEICYIASGLRLPIVMAIASRALSAPINIHCDHSDVYSVRDAGWITFFTKNVQEAYDFSIISFKVAETCNFPTMFVEDGFIISHCVEACNVLEDNLILSFVGEKRENILYSLEEDVTVGPVALHDSYIKFKCSQQEELFKTINKIEEVLKEFKKISCRDYKLVEEYNPDGKNAIVCLGSVFGTIKYYLEKNNIKDWSLIYLRLFRPFPEELIKILENKEKVIVMDRGVSFGSYGPLYLEISSRLKNEKVFNVIYGLGGKDFNLDNVKTLLKLEPKDKRQIWII